MDTVVTDEQRELLDASARFMERTCPISVLRDGSWRDDGFAASYRKQAAEFGWFSMVVPESMAGGNISGNGVLDASLIAYRRGSALQPGSYVGTNVVAYAVARAGSDDMRSRVLPALISGDAAATWIPHAGQLANRADDAVTARPTADGGFELHGLANAVQDVEAGSWLLVACMTPNGTAQVLVAPGTPGATVTQLDSLDITRCFAAVRFDSVLVPSAAVVGTPGADGDLRARQLALACTLLAADSVGAMDHDFAITVQYAKDRIAFGRPIGSFQAVKHQLADASLALEMSKAMVLAAADAVGADDGYGLEAASMAKAFVSESGIDLVQTCFQVFGGIGYTWEHDQHLYLRRITTNAGLFGDASWHREYLCQLAGL